MTNIFNRFSSRPKVSVIRLEGVIGGSGRFGSALTDVSLAPLIERAFKGKPQAVALAINSPGGSPTQSALIEARIRRLADEKSVPVYAFCEDVAASGGYWLATAADEIYVDASSIVGSRPRPGMDQCASLLKPGRKKDCASTKRSQFLMGRQCSW